MNVKRITADPTILFGKPVIAGTRISVELILDKLGDGDSIAELLSDYPHLSDADIRAAIQFAARAIRIDTVYPFERASA